MLRKVTLTGTNLVIHFGVAQAIHNWIQEQRPDLYMKPDTQYATKQDVIKAYAKVIGISVAVALVASAVAALATNGVDHIAFPNEAGTPF